MIEDIHSDPYDYTWGIDKRSKEKKFEIICESSHDAAMYNRLIGPNLGRWIRFSANERNVCTERDVDGALGAHKAMRASRERHARYGSDDGPSNTYCLLDGEELSRIGSDRCHFPGAPAVISARDVKIPADLGGRRTFRSTDGILFLNCYELENIYLLKTNYLANMTRHWGESRNFYGSQITVDRAWKLLQFALVGAKLQRFANFYNIGHAEFKKNKNLLLKGQIDPWIGLKIVLECLGDPPADKINATQRSSLNRIRRALPGLDKSIKDILNGNSDIEKFHPALLAECDGKTLFYNAKLTTGDWHEYCQSQLFSNSFGTTFQMSIVHALESDRCSYLQHHAFKSTNSPDERRSSLYSQTGGLLPAAQITGLKKWM